MDTTTAPSPLHTTFVCCIVFFGRGGGVGGQVCTVLLFLFVAAWPFAPILVHWKPWSYQPTLAFLVLLLTLAWVLVARSHSIFAALLSSWLTLALTGLTAWEYTTEQVRLHQ